ncbi:hypothetical protein D915_008200 [Fasciola hepatica]|uniref:Uncharacterized protein n=1 Tax=Fasciola hepatica TaxID=6192 RepID=A0A4E0RY70_FASHE|nr:hypothetical protein D915_008200 [Fasciola hepatica]
MLGAEENHRKHNDLDVLFVSTILVMCKLN